MSVKLHIAICDDEKYIHDMAEGILGEYGKEKDCDIKITHFFFGERAFRIERGNTDFIA